MRAWVVLSLAAMLAGGQVAAQRVETMRAGVGASPAPSTDSTQRARAASISREQLRKYSPVLSAMVPGTGQLALGKDNAVLYGAVELLMWLKVAKDVSEQRNATNDFVTIARDVARVNFAQRDTSDWLYYEHVRKYLESGDYNKGTGGTFIPETDVSTYNGEKWFIAQRNHPDLAGAVAEYQEVAIKPGFLWSWRNAQLHWDLFKRKTEQRNDAAGRWRIDLGIIGANHVLSMVDAFQTVRLRARALATGGVALTGSIPVGAR